MNRKAGGVEALEYLLAYLTAAYHSHWTTHWTSKGKNFYGDHELFARLYGTFPDEIDGLAEKMVALYGEDSVDFEGQASLILELAQKWGGTKDRVMRAWTVENGLQEAIAGAEDALDADDDLTLGLDNFLAGLADAHETPLYLLGQRLAPDEGAVSASRLAFLHQTKTASQKTALRYKAAQYLKAA